MLNENKTRTARAASSLPLPNALSLPPSLCSFSPLFQNFSFSLHSPLLHLSSKRATHAACTALLPTLSVFVLEEK